MTNREAENKYSIFEQRRALKEFEAAVNDPVFFERLADDLFIYDNFPLFFE